MKVGGIRCLDGSSQDQEDLVLQLAKKELNHEVFATKLLTEYSSHPRD